MKLVVLLSMMLSFSTPLCASEEITPYKFSDEDYTNNQIPYYEIPASSRFTVQREEIDSSEIIYYLSTPRKLMYPIAILCGGSSSKDNIISIIHFHRYFLKEFQELGSAVLTAEQFGVDGQKIDAVLFMRNYTRSQRLADHRTIINYLKRNPPKGWNGKFIFLGVSEGGPLVTTLSSDYHDVTLATINWSGAGDWNWRDELWKFIEGMRSNIPWYIKLRSLIPQSLPFSLKREIPTRADYDFIMDETLLNPSSNEEFLGMTYKYHADALNYPPYDYINIRNPYLVVAGAHDTIIDSTDIFVEKAKNALVPITYFRISDMDHYVRKRPDVVQQTFQWLKDILQSSAH